MQTLLLKYSHRGGGGLKNGNILRATFMDEPLLNLLLFSLAMAVNWLPFIGCLSIAFGPSATLFLCTAAQEAQVGNVFNYNFMTYFNYGGDIHDQTFNKGGDILVCVRNPTKLQPTDYLNFDRI